MPPTPPFNRGQLDKDLANNKISVYIYLGTRDDPGGDAAYEAQLMLPKLAVHYTPDRNQVSDLSNDPEAHGLVFDLTPSLKRELDATEVQDPDLVMDAITQARA